MRGFWICVSRLSVLKCGHYSRLASLVVSEAFDDAVVYDGVLSGQGLLPTSRLLKTGEDPQEGRDEKFVATLHSPSVYL